MIHIIHNHERHLRYVHLMYELRRQDITDYKLWPAILDRRLICRGVSQAHKAIVQYAKDCGLSQVTIMEDDVKFPALDGYAYYLREMPADFDIYLGGIYQGNVDDDKTVKGGFSSLHLYTVRAKFYDTFLSVDETLHLDRGLEGLGDFHVCYPFAAIQYNGFSDVERAPTNYHNLLHGKLIHT